jgi:dihydroorotate dehydrogenase (fumarate)
MDLSTRYLGLALKSPLIASASPLTGDLGNIRRLEDLGAAAVALPSLFEEEIAAEESAADRLTADPRARVPLRFTWTERPEEVLRPFSRTARSMTSESHRGIAESGRFAW